MPDPAQVQGGRVLMGVGRDDLRSDCIAVCRIESSHLFDKLKFEFQHFVCIKSILFAKNEFCLYKINFVCKKFCL